MIKGFNTGTTGGYLHVNGHNYTPHISPNANNPSTGMLRVNGSNYEVFDGSSWQQFGTYADISLSQAAIAALDWCQRKMTEEAKIKELCDKSPTVADAYEKYNRAKEQLEVVLTLTDNP